MDVEQVKIIDAASLSEDEVRAVNEGTFEVDLTRHLGQAGMQWSNGRLRLEQNPLLVPIEARGLRSNPGRWFSLSKDAGVEASIGRKVRTLAGAAWRLEKPEVPEWMKEDAFAQIALDLQWEYCQRVFHTWTKTGKGFTLTKWIREVSRVAPTYGFYLGELRATQKVVIMGDDLPRNLWFPDLPEYRANWSVDYWLTQNERFVGVIFSYDYVTDYRGRRTGGRQVVIPAEKLVLLSMDKIGTNHEGTSRMRAVSNEIDMGRGALETEAVAVEVHGTGEVFFEVRAGTSEEDIAELEDYSEHRKADHAPGGVVPEGTKVHVVSPTSTMPDMSGIQERLGNRVLLGMGSEDRSMGDAAGTFAARKDASTGSSAENDDDASQIVSEPLEEVLARFIRLNSLDFGSDDYCFVPSVTNSPVAEKDPGERVEALGKYFKDVRPNAPEHMVPVLDEMMNLPVAEEVTSQ